MNPTKLEHQKPPDGNSAEQARYEELGAAADQDLDQEFDDFGHELAGGGPDKTPPAVTSKPRPAAPRPKPAASDPADPAPRPAPTGANPAPPAAASLPGSDAGSGGVAGFALGLVATAVLINFMRGGTAGVRAWFSAKFLNVVAPGAVAPPAPGTPARGTGSIVQASMTTTAGAAATLPGTSPWGAW